ncbi:MAG: hypothetical protein K5881_08140 [Saccharofermentans sp.]|nr:hypothetical protein [Saccharofermentans sp.]
MINEYKDILFKVIHLRSIIGYNSLVFALKKTPVIGNLIPDKLYSTTFLKVIYWIFHVIVEVFKLFIGKIFGLGMIYLAAFLLSDQYIEHEMVQGVSRSAMYGNLGLFIFLLYAFCGILIRVPYFNCTTEKEYLVFMLRMDAKKLNETLIWYDLAKLFIGYVMAGIFAVITGAPFWLWLGIPVLALAVKFLGIGLQILSFRFKSRLHKSLKISAVAYLIRLALVLLAGPFFIVFVANGYFIPMPQMVIITVLTVIAGIWGLMMFLKTDSNLHRRALHDNISKTEVKATSQYDNTKSFKKIKAKGTVKGDKKGFEYLNALFVKRHWTMLCMKPVIFTIIVAAVMILLSGEFIYGYYSRYGADNCWNMVITNIINFFTFRGFSDALLPVGNDPAFEFFRYVAQSHLLALMIPLSISDNSFKNTQAMFINCDNSLMTFSFFKQREKIIKLFDIRLKQLIKINIGPVVSLGLFADLILFVTGGQSYPGEYLVTILVGFMLSILTSVTWLALYYLFQPFTTSVVAKSGAYRITSIIIYSVASILVWVPLVSYILAPVLLVFTAGYVFFLRNRVYKLAPKTWKIKA